MVTLVVTMTDTTAAPDAPANEFSLELNQDQKDSQEWVHGFAEKVVRPAAAEWDEREETPWPIIQEAAKIGLYGFESIAHFWGDPTGLTLPIVNEELFWGDAGIGMAIMGTSLAVAGIFGSGTPEQAMEWIPQCFGTEDEPKVAASAAPNPNPHPNAPPPRRLPRARQLPARRQGEARRAPRPRPRGQAGQVAGRHADLRGQPADGRRAGHRHRPRRLRVRARLRQGARAVRQADRREPGG